MVASWGYGVRGSEQTALVVLKDSPIKSIKDLEGKKVGGFLKATEFGMQQQQLFESEGVGDYHYVELGIANAIAALQSGSVDAVTLIQPTITILQDKIRILASYNEVDARGYGFTKAFIEKHPAIIKMPRIQLIITILFFKRNIYLLPNNLIIAVFIVKGM